MKEGTAKLLWATVIVALGAVAGVGAPGTFPIDTFLSIYGKGNLHQVIDMDVFALIKAIGAAQDKFSYNDRDSSDFFYGTEDVVEAARTATRTGVAGMAFTEYQYKILSVRLSFYPSIPAKQVLQILGYPTSLALTQGKIRIGSTPYQTFTAKVGTRTLSLAREHLTDAIWRVDIW